MEVTFDNADNRFPTSGSEVVLRRTIGLKKDEYSIDRRSASKADVSNLLEAAGFSRANPYYIVPQGRITHLTNAKDHERLELLKEVAGTKVYEQRRAESIKIMEETESKRAKIRDMLGYIEGKISELDADKEELQRYYVKDKERRCLEYTLYQRELQDISDVLDRLEQERQKDLDSTAASVTGFNDRSRDVVNFEDKVASLRRKLEELQLERTQAEQERRDLAKELARGEMLISSMQEEQESAAESRDDLLRDLARVEERIQEKEKELTQIRPQWEAKSQALADLRSQAEQTRSAVSTLHSKQGRAAQFNSQADRDAWLEKQIAELTRYESDQQERIGRTREGIVDAKAKLQEVEASRTQISETIEGRKEALQALATEWRSAREKRDKGNEQKK